MFHKKNRPTIASFIWMLSASSLSLTACSLGPDYKHPDDAAPAAWNDPQGGLTAAWPSATWWQGFGSPELNDLMTKAQQGNFDIAAAVARVKEADAQALIAGAPLFPSVGVGTAATRERTVDAGTKGTGSTYNEYNPLLSASYELDFWGKNRAALESAKALANASRYDRATVELTIMTEIASTYFQALELQDRLKIAEENYKNAKDTLDGLQDELTVGTATALDVAQQDTTVATLSAVIPPLRQQLRQTIDALAILIGQPPEKFDVAPASLAHLSEPVVTPGLPSELLARRPDVAEAEANLISANANIKEARAAMFPSITLTAAGGYESAALAGLFSPGSTVFALSAGLTQPIFEGGLLEGAYQFNKARYEELLADYHKSVITAFGNVEDALNAVRQTAEQRKEQQDSVDKAQLAYDLAMAQFHAGTINILTVLSTETALFTARDTLAQVQLAHLQAVLQLYNALGGGWLPAQEKNNG